MGNLTNSLTSVSALSLKKKVVKPTFKGRLKRACKQIFYLETPIHEKGLKNPYLICDICGGAHEADECDKNNPTDQRNKEVEGGPEWVIKSKFENQLSNFMLEKKFHTKGIGEMLDQHRKGRPTS
ncbi:hypothetical protein Tco_1307694 [Tanacetum coccineum]